jgi:hypothetical protein
MEYAQMIDVGQGFSAMWVVLGVFVMVGIMLRCEGIEEFYKHFNSGIYNHIELPQVQKNKCPGCDQYISDYDLQPHGGAVTTRSMHAHCHEQFFKRIHLTCIICRGDIRHNVGKQQGNWKEVFSHICDSPECLAKWSYIHAGVHGIAQQALAQQEFALPDLDEDGYLPSGNVVDADFEDLGSGRKVVAFRPVNNFRRLPSPVKQMTLDEMFKEQWQRKRVPIRMDLNQ